MIFCPYACNKSAEMAVMDPFIYTLVCMSSYIRVIKD